MAGIKILAAVGAFLVIAAFIGVGETAVAIQKSIEKPDKYAGECGCYSDVLDVVLLTLVEVNPIDGVHCQRFVCQENGDTLIETCGVIGLPPGCTAKMNLTKPYPSCCASENVVCT